MSHELGAIVRCDMPFSSMQVSDPTVAATNYHVYSTVSCHC